LATTDQNSDVSSSKRYRPDQLTRQVACHLAHGVAGHGEAWHGPAGLIEPDLYLSVLIPRHATPLGENGGALNMGSDLKADGLSPAPLERRITSYWRTLPAHAFDTAQRTDVHDWLRNLSSTSPEWRAAIGGDVACAIGVALRLWPLHTVCPITDVVMTILLAVALKDAAAANVLSTSLKQIPISHRRRTTLAKSWIRHQANLAGLAPAAAHAPRQRGRKS
jgi:hypothetical protein